MSSKEDGSDWEERNVAIYGNSNDEEVYYSCQPTGTGKKIHGIWKDQHFGEQHSLLTDAFQKLNTFASEGPQTQSHSAVQKEWRTLLCLKVLCVLTAAGIIALSICCKMEHLKNRINKFFWSRDHFYVSIFEHGNMDEQLFISFCNKLLQKFKIESRQRQQIKPKYPDFCRHSNFLQLSKGETQITSRPSNRRCPSSTSWDFPLVSSRWGMPRIPLREGSRAHKCPNHLSCFSLMWSSSGSSLHEISCNWSTWYFTIVDHSLTQ